MVTLTQRHTTQLNESLKNRIAEYANALTDAKVQRGVKTMENKLVLTVEEMGNLLGISRPTAYELIHAQDGPPILRIGRRVVIPQEGLRRWIEERSQKRA